MTEPNALQPTTLGVQYKDPNAVVPLGQRREYTARVRALVAQAGDSAREAFADPAIVAAYVKAIHDGIMVRDRTALNLYSQVMKLIGEERRITVEFIHSLGASSEEELKRYVDAAKSVEGAGPHDGAERCVAYLEAYLNAFPEGRGAFVRRLGGYVPVEAG